MTGSRDLNGTNIIHVSAVLLAAPASWIEWDEQQRSHEVNLSLCYSLFCCCDEAPLTKANDGRKFILAYVPEE